VPVAVFAARVPKLEDGVFVIFGVGNAAEFGIRCSKRYSLTSARLKSATPTLALPSWIAKASRPPKKGATEITPKSIQTPNRLGPLSLTVLGVIAAALAGGCGGATDEGFR